MGVLGKVATGRLIQPLSATVGAWIEPLLAESDIIDRRVALNLALFRSFIDADPGDAESYFVFSNEKRVNAVGMAPRTKSSVIRADSKERRITCAAPGHGWFTSDWTLQANVGDSSNAVVQVIQRRTIDDSVPNSDLLKDSRDGLARALLNGPGRVELSQTGFNLDELVDRRAPSPNTTFDGDHYQPVPECFRDGARIELPTGSLAAVQDSLSAGKSPSIGGGGQEGIALDGGRGVNDCYIELITDEPPALVFHLPPEGTISAQRTFRAALRCLDRLALGLGPHPEAAAAVTAFIQDCTADRQNPDRNTRFLAAWGGDEPTGVIALRPGIRLPLISRIRTTSSPANLDSYMNAAGAWVLPRERSWSQGLRQATRDQNRHYTMRGPAQLMVGGKRQRIYRYGEYASAGLERHQFIDETTPWFWQVNGVYNDLDDGRVQAVISLTSLSRTQDMICYATELARFLAAFEWHVTSHDPNAEFETVNLVV